MRHNHVGEDHMCGLLLQHGKRGLASIGFQACETQRLAYGCAEFADTLLVIHDQQTDSKVVTTHSAFPMVFSTTDMNCRTRNGFSTQGAPVLRRVSTVSSLAMSPVMKMILETSSGRFFAIQVCRSTPFTPPGVRISETTPRNSPDSRIPRASTPDSAQITG